MTGSKPKGERIPLDEFMIEEYKFILSCPKEQPAQDARYDEEQKVLEANFDSQQCQQCELIDKCPVKVKKNGDAIVSITLKSLVAAETRRRLESNDRANAVSHRAAIEGTNSAIKRGQGMGKLRVCETFKCKVVVGMKVAGHNMQQVFSYLLKKAKNDLKFSEDKSALLAN